MIVNNGRNNLEFILFSYILILKYMDFMTFSHFILAYMYSCVLFYECHHVHRDRMVTLGVSPHLLPYFESGSLCYLPVCGPGMLAQEILGIHSPVSTSYLTIGNCYYRHSIKAEFFIGTTSQLCPTGRCQGTTQRLIIKCLAKSLGLFLTSSNILN